MTAVQEIEPGGYWGKTSATTLLLCCIVTMRNTEYSLRRSENIAIPRFQSGYLEQSVSYRGAILRNATAFRHPDLTRTER